MPNSPLDGLHILVVEDEFYLADDLARELRNAGAFTVGPIGSIVEAEATMARRRVDAAILDLNLRGTRTDEFAQRLLHDGLPCLIVSGYSKEAVAAPLRNANHLEKPADAATIVSTLADLVEKRALGPAEGSRSEAPASGPRTV